MSTTPRRSSRLQAVEEDKVHREKILRIERERVASRRQKAAKNGGTTGSDSDQERTSSEGSSSDGEAERDGDMITPTQTSARRRINNFTRVYHTYNRDYDLDWYEREFIDDTELRTPRRKLCQSKEGTRSGRQSRKSVKALSSSEEEEEEEEGRVRAGKKPNLRRKQLEYSSSDETGECGTLLPSEANVKKRKEGEGEGEEEGNEGEGEEEGEKLVMPIRKRKRKRPNALHSDEQESSSEDPLSSAKPPSTRKRRYKQLESDEEEDLDTSCRRSSRVRKQKEDKDREREEKLRRLRANRARVKVEALRGSEGEGEERDSEGEGEERESEGEEKGEEDIDPADRLQHELFPELACSDEDDDDCDWLVTNLDDYSEVDQALSHMLSMTQDPEVGERSWKDGLSVRHLLPPASGPVCVDQWTGEPTSAIASTKDDNGVLPLVYAAACAHSSSFSSLLPLTPTGELQDFLTSKGTSLLHFILEAPLRPSSFDQSEEVRESEIPADRDSDSLACLQTLWNYSRSQLMEQLEESPHSRPSVLELAVWHSKPKVG